MKKWSVQRAARTYESADKGVSERKASEKQWDEIDARINDWSAA